MTLLDYRDHFRLHCSDDSFLRWVGLSNAVSAAPREGRRQSMNAELLAWSESTSEGVFRSVYRYWLASDLLAAGAVEDAHTRFAEVVELEAGAGSPCTENALARTCHVELADLAGREGRIDAQLRHLQDLRQISESTDPTPEYLSGLACEAAGRLDEALSFFRSIGDEADTGDVNSVTQLARRAIARIEADPARFQDLQSAVKMLGSGLLEGDELALRRIVSRSHFRVGLGAHWHFADATEILPQLIRDLRRRPIAITGQQKARSRVRILTEGWKGDWFAGEISFELSEWVKGWSWTGVTISANPHCYGTQLEPAPRETNQSLPFQIKAPWDRGDRSGSKTFMAGGIEDVSESPIITASRGILGLFGFLPIIGPIARAVNAFLEPARGAERTRQIALSLRDCGFGLRGFYYNAFASHQGADAFAIDFTDYSGFVPASDGWPVLAAAPGRVEFARYSTAHSDEPGNAVEIMSFHEGEPFLLRYLHLAQEGSAPAFAGPVRRGMFVAQGAHLGRIDNTGNSAFSHLHFSIHDQTRPHVSREAALFGGVKGISIRPTPMDGVRLGNGDETTCVASSNGGTPAVTILAPRAGEEFFALTRRVTLSALISGGARPVRVTWSSDLEPRLPLIAVDSSTERSDVDVIFRVAGRHRLRVSIRDALLRTVQAEVEFRIVNNPPQVAIERPFAGERVAANARVLLQGRSFDPEAGARLRDDQVAWFLDGASSAVATGHLSEIEPGRLLPGPHRLRFVGNDGREEIADERSFETVPAVPDLAPNIRILSPPDGARFSPGMTDATTGLYFQPVALVGEAVDPEEGALSGDHLIWSVTAPDGTVTEVGRGNSVFHNFVATEPFSTLYEIRLTATDAAGRSDSVTAMIALQLLS